MEEFLEKIKPYEKHNLYTRVYRLDEFGRVVGIPRDAKWMAMAFEGYSNGLGHFNPEGKGDIVVLILNDEQNSFFPVISFLTKDEARQLAHDLLKIVE
jgi:hypothetical protein